MRWSEHDLGYDVEVSPTAPRPVAPSPRSLTLRPECDHAPLQAYLHIALFLPEAIPCSTSWAGKGDIGRPNLVGSTRQGWCDASGATACGHMGAAR